MYVLRTDRNDDEKVGLTDSVLFVIVYKNRISPIVRDSNHFSFEDYDWFIVKQFIQWHSFGGDDEFCNHIYVFVFEMPNIDWEYRNDSDDAQSVFDRHFPDDDSDRVFHCSCSFLYYHRIVRT